MRKNKSIDKKIRKKKIGLIFILLFLLTTIFIVLLTKTSFFHLAEINITGNQILEKDKIIMASGLVIGENIFKINTEGVKRNLLNHPYIKNVVIKRKLPNKIDISIEERNETVIISYIGSYIYLDNEGIILNILSNKKDDTLPEIIGLNIKKCNIGEKIELNNEQNIEQIMLFIEECGKVGMFCDITSINITDGNNIKFMLKSGIKVAFGDLDNVKYKLEFTKEILQNLYEKSKEEGRNILGTIDFTKGNFGLFTRDSD